MKLSYRQKLLIAFIIVTIILILWYIFILKPQQRYISDTRKEITKISKEITLAKSSVGNVDAIRKDNQNIQTELDSLLLSIPKREQISSITNLIVSTGRKNELDVINIQPSLDALLKSKDYLIKVPIEITLKGKYLNFGQFITDIQNLSSKLYIQNISIDADQDDKDGDRSQLQIQISSYVFVINEKQAV
ncbi:MAG: type 4a pilus biogenesis protein PilO [Candidatus Marinimicrobia bacterium]|nr:type 4a pilus biogenesis protein PilO [Candidatus Neomarinimicrobiota bacterium]